MARYTGPQWKISRRLDVYKRQDPGYNSYNRDFIEDNADLLNVPIKIFESNIFDVVSTVDKSPCYLGAKMRRGYLYSKAQELGCKDVYKRQ